MNPTQPTVSVAIATYNGAPYIREQLASIVAQTECPAEIVLVDDSSTDETLRVLQEFAADASLPVRIYKNEKNLGTAKSFEKAISLCSGDFIALSDQDDVWVSDKIATLLATIKSQSLDGIFSDAFLVDQHLIPLTPLSRTLFINSNFTPPMRRRFHAGHSLGCLLRYNVVTGATLVFHRRWIPLILPIGLGWNHDYWIALLIASRGKLNFCNKPLIYYRQHPHNQIGMRDNLDGQLVSTTKKPNAEYLDEAKLFAFLRERLTLSAPQDSRHLGKIKAKEDFLKRRYRLRSSFVVRLPLFLYNLLTGQYFWYAQGWKPLLKDLFLP